ncbi:MAG TPA: DUF3231 family protein [Oscillospiraceae bacterium]|nr:DUF3231 family protein [Oscillospiraceae bacterium]
MKITALLTKKPEKKANDVDIREAFTLWDILNSKYTTLEQLLMCDSFTEDAELKLLLKKIELEIEENITILQKQMKKYNIISPNKNRAAVVNYTNQDLMTDEAIAMQMLLYEQEHVENLVLAVYSIITNDNLRKVIIEMLLRTLKSTDMLMKQAAIRGWVGIPPAYQHLPADTTEKIHCGEAGCLWDMLTYRYDTLHSTEIMTNIVKDVDLKVIFTAGIQLLKDQIKQLEKELVYFGITLPKRPGEITAALDNKDLWEDSHIYRMTLMGMQGAGTLHVRAFKKLSSSHRLRNYMMKLLWQEVEKIDDLIRYGKVKGWLQQVPRYGP